MEVNSIYLVISKGKQMLFEIIHVKLKGQQILRKKSGNLW